MGPEEIWENYIHHIVESRDGPDGAGRYPIRDIALLGPMLRSIGFRAGKPPGADWPESDKPRHLYSCIHLMPTGLCRIQWFKPHMCKIYEICEYPDCESGCFLPDVSSDPDKTPNRKGQDAQFEWGEDTEQINPLGLARVKPFCLQDGRCPRGG
jgi:Fe-S-cluster containining protein